MIGRIVAIPFAIVVIAFAVANRHGVAISLDPLPVRFELPLYVIAIGALVIGFAAGGVVAWLHGAKARRLARIRKRRVDDLERELTRTAAKANEDKRLPPTASAA